MAKRMNAQLMGLSMANQNASDGVSIIETADGAMSDWPWPCWHPHIPSGKIPHSAASAH